MLYYICNGSNSVFSLDFSRQVLFVPLCFQGHLYSVPTCSVFMLSLWFHCFTSSVATVFWGARQGAFFATQSRGLYTSNPETNAKISFLHPLVFGFSTNCSQATRKAGFVVFTAGGFIHRRSILFEIDILHQRRRTSRGGSRPAPTSFAFLLKMLLSVYICVHLWLKVFPWRRYTIPPYRLPHA